MNADHLICQNSGDDMFDTDLGFRGHLQYIFGRTLIEGTSSDPNGFEWDGNQDDLAAPGSGARASSRLERHAVRAQQERERPSASAP